MTSAQRTASILTTLLCVLLVAGRGEAQVGNRLALGMSVTTLVAGSPETTNSANLGLEVRIGHEQPGWGPALSLFGWFDLGVQQAVTPAGSSGSSGVPLGSLRMRPMMVGYGYTKVRGRATIMADVVGGYSFNSFELTPAAAAEYRTRTGAQALEGHGGNAFTVKPEVVVWYDLNDRFALKLSGGYLLARPSVTLSSSLGDDTRPVRADVFLVTLGVVYSLF